MTKAVPRVSGVFPLRENSVFTPNNSHSDLTNSAKFAEDVEHLLSGNLVGEILYVEDAIHLGRQLAARSTRCHRHLECEKGRKS